MFFVQGVDVVCAVVSAVHDKLDLFVSENIKLTDQFTDRFDIRDVPGKLPVIKRQAAVFSEQKRQVDLRKVFAILVFAVPDLLHRLRIAGDRRAVIGPVLFFGPAFPLQPEEVHLGFFSNGLEDLRTPLGGDVVSVRMTVQLCPFPKTEQRVLVFQDQVVRNGEDLLVSCRETGLKICRHTGRCSDLIE